MRKRLLPLLAFGLPAAFVVTLLIWGVVSNQGNPGRPGVNEVLGEVIETESRKVNFELPTLEGETLSLNDFRGQIVMVDFWSSWCAPCRAEVPALVDSYERWKDSDVQFIAVSIWDDEQAVSEFVQTRGVTYPVVIDRFGATAIEFGVIGIPEKFFITPDGIVRRKVVGPNTEESLNKIIGELKDEALGFFR